MNRCGPSGVDRRAAPRTQPRNWRFVAMPGTMLALVLPALLFFVPGRAGGAG